MYLIDTNVLIEAKNRYYAFDIAPGFWDWLDRAHASSFVCSIEAVKKELTVSSDPLAQWAKAHPAFFQPMDAATVAEFPNLSSWANSRQFRPNALANFTGNHADFLLIAYAKAHGHTVVTHETSQPNARSRILIPDACLGVGVPSVDTFEMLRMSGAKLQLV